MTNRLQRESALNPVRMKRLRRIKNILQENLIVKDRNGLKYLMMKDINLT